MLSILKKKKSSSENNWVLIQLPRGSSGSFIIPGILN